MSHINKEFTISSKREKVYMSGNLASFFSDEIHFLGPNFFFKG